MTDGPDVAPDLDNAELTKRFHRAALASYEVLSRLGYGERDHIDEIGGVEVARRSLSQEIVTNGFSRLWEMGKLEMSLEALATRSEFRSLFTDGERRIAHERLQAHGYSAN